MESAIDDLGSSFGHKLKNFVRFWPPPSPLNINWGRGFDQHFGFNALMLITLSLYMLLMKCVLHSCEVILGGFLFLMFTSYYNAIVLTFYRVKVEVGWRAGVQPHPVWQTSQSHAQAQ